MFEDLRKWGAPKEAFEKSNLLPEVAQ